METAYTKAIEFIRQHPATGSAVGMAKLLLSLYNDEAAFSYRECVSNFDSERLRLAMDVIEHFNHVGETKELVSIGSELCDRYPSLWEMGYAGTVAKIKVRDGQTQ